MENDCSSAVPAGSDDHFDTSLTLSSLLSSVLGSIEDMDCNLENIDPSEESKQCPISQETSVVDACLSSIDVPADWNEDQSYSHVPTWDVALVDPPVPLQWEPTPDDHNQICLRNERPLWDPTAINCGYPVSWQPTTDGLNAGPTMSDVMHLPNSRSSFGYDIPYASETVHPDEAVVPWVPNSEFQGTSAPYYNVCELPEESIGGYYCGAPPHIKSKRLEHVVSIKIENPTEVPFQRYANSCHGVPFPEGRGTVQAYQQGCVWGLTVEQRQTQQTTFRYFPRTCDPSCWQTWPLDMPGSEENSRSPDPTGSLGPRSSSPNGRSASRSPNSKRVEGKRCGVCGDRALGYNFNAITCESCKAFFRRNALKNKEYRCPFNDECEVTAVTRRFCQRCRLRKCFEIGMKKEWIMTEEEKKKKRKKIEENRARKVGDMDSSSPGAVTSPMSTGGESSVAMSPTHHNGEEEAATAAAAVLEGFEALEDTGCPPFSSGLDLPSLPQKQTAKALTTKPKAVVVGRVREHENEAKVRKNCQQADVHTPKVIQPSLKVEEPSDTRLTEDPSKRLSEFSSVTLPELRPQLPLSFQVSPLVSPEGPPSGSLVVGLLRSRSQGSAEDDSSITSPGNVGCHGESGSVIKFEAVEEPLESSSPPPSASLDPISQKQCSPQPLSFTGSVSASETYHCDEAKVFPPRSLQNAKFEFSIREALTMIQPGCKDASTSSSFTVMESIMNTAISAEYSAFSLLTNSHSSELNQAETIKITELLNASRGLNTPLCEEPNYKDLPNPSLINVINLTEIAIRRFIKMAKKISAFKTFCQEDQIALLKGGCTEMMILRSVSAYDPDKDAWKIQQDHERFKNIKLKVLKAASGNVYEMHKRFMLSFLPEWRQDTMIIALLAAIALFTPERANVIHPEAVRHEQCSYLFLLKRYLESKYGGCVGKTNYMKLLEIIGNLHILNEDHVRVFLEVDPQEVEPLLIEIFDLKQS